MTIIPYPAIPRAELVITLAESPLSTLASDAVKTDHDPISVQDAELLVSLLLPLSSPRARRLLCMFAHVAELREHGAEALPTRCEERKTKVYRR